MNLYKQFGDEINRRFGKSIASTSGNGESVELKFEKASRIDHVVIQEDIVFGERVREYIIEGQSGDKWVELAKGTSIGYKRIERFKTVEVTAIRVRFTRFSYPPVIKNLSVYFVGVNAATAIQDKKDEILLGSTVLDKSGKFEVDLSDFIKMAGQYELSVLTKENATLKIRSSNLILQGVATPGFIRIQENGNCNINITAHPSGGKGTIRVTGQVENEKNNQIQYVKFYLSKY
jgi:alpha-L-fucosidase